MDERNCPKCGAAVGPQLASTRMVNCPSCGTSLFLKDDRFELAGSAGVMHDVPMLLALGDHVTINGRPWHLIGQARFSYGRGFWDEFWAVGAGDRTAWISVDEGDVVVQTQLDADRAPAMTTPPLFGGTLNWDRETFQMAEMETARCEAFKGTLPEVMAVGETYHFANFTDEQGRLLSGEFWPGGCAWFVGDWVDPFDLRKQVAS